MATLQRLDCEIEFITPAFLGDARQRGHWRVPPFKALLRRWWRILEAPSCNYDWRELRRREGLIWGNAFLDEPPEGKPKLKNGHIRSLIALRLANWNKGQLFLKDWRKTVHMGKVAPRPHHPDQQIPADLYLGYGPVDQRSRQLSKSREPAINAGETNTLTLSWKPMDQIQEEMINRLLGLIHLFGAAGSRANNGWGSLQIQDQPFPSTNDIPAIDFQVALQRDWPHAVGMDEKGLLIWQSRAFSDWNGAMNFAARVLSVMRTIGKRAKGPGLTGVFLLGYPVQGPHAIRRLPRESRWAAQMRLKVMRPKQGEYRTLVFHLPHRPPPPLWNRFDAAQRKWVEQNQAIIWNAIHTWLDEKMERWEGKK
jgi:CRISPR-associated protein Cmr1